MLCHRPQCENGKMHNYCYEGPHISKVADLPAKCKLDLDAILEHTECEACTKAEEEDDDDDDDDDDEE
jgi:succinyl-CoA synthetase beta subunit